MSAMPGITNINSVCRNPKFAAVMVRVKAVGRLGEIPMSSSRFMMDNPRKNVDTNPQKKLDNYVLADWRINKAAKIGNNMMDLYLGINWCAQNELGLK